MKEKRSKAFIESLQMYKKAYPEYSHIFESAFVIIDRKLKERWNIIEHSIKTDKSIFIRDKYNDECNWFLYIGNAIAQDIKSLKTLLKKNCPNRQTKVMIKKYFTERKLERMVNLVVAGFYSAYIPMFSNRIYSALSREPISKDKIELYGLIVRNAGEESATKNFNKITKQLYKTGALQQTKSWNDIVKSDSTNDMKITFNSLRGKYREDFSKWYRSRIKKGFSHRQILNELGIIKYY
jgi:hypothetical protein